MKTKYYAGIGARKTPKEILKIMYLAAYKLADKGWILRSGGAKGADQFFQEGCQDWCDENGLRYKKRQEIYLPWDGFNSQKVSKKKGITTEQSYFAIEVADEHHPNYDNLSPAAQKLMTRNTMQIFGVDMDLHSKFVLCWTPDGAKSKTTKMTGGTGQAIRMAIANNIPVYNLENNMDRYKIENWLGI